MIIFQNIPAFFHMPIVVSAMGVFTLMFIVVKVSYCRSTRQRSRTQMTTETDIVIARPSDDDTFTEGQDIHTQCSSVSEDFSCRSTQSHNTETSQDSFPKSIHSGGAGAMHSQIDSM